LLPFKNSEGKGRNSLVNNNYCFMYGELVGIIIILKDGEKLLKAVKYVGPVGDENSS
jgi:hypothetical protein